MRVVRASLAIVAALMCGAWRGHPWVYPVVHADAYVASGEVRTTADDPILLRQRMLHGPFARIDAPLQVVRGSKTYAVSPENLMFAGESSGRRVFCTYDATYSGRNSLGIGATGRTCLEDNNQDGAFEAIAWVAIADFSRNIVQFSADIEPAVTYTLVDNATPPSMELVVRYALRSGQAVLETAYVEGVFEELLQDEVVRVPPTSALPTIVTLHGAQIQIISHADDVLTYRVIRGFDPSEHRPIDLPRW